MEARIAQRLQHHASTQEVAFSWRDLLAGSSLAGAWWRGALTGAAIALFAISVVLLLEHHSQIARSQVAQNAIAHDAMSMPAAPVARVKADKPAANPCPPSPSALQLHRAAPLPKATLLRVASTERHPILSGPLTARRRARPAVARADRRSTATRHAQLQRPRRKQKPRTQPNLRSSLPRRRNPKHNKRTTETEPGLQGRCSMKLANGFFAITLAAAFSGLPAQAQPAAAPAKPEMQVRTFYLNNTVQGSDDGREILNALRASRFLTSMMVLILTPVRTRSSSTPLTPATSHLRRRSSTTTLTASRRPIVSPIR